MQQYKPIKYIQEAEDKIVQISPISIPIEAVFYDGGELLRSPVLCMALDSLGNISLMDSDSHGYIENPDNSNNFLGYEYHNKKLEWKQQIKEYLQNVENRNKRVEELNKQVIDR